MANHEMNLGWGILGTGSISRQFGGGVKVSKTGNIVAVGSRTAESGQAFCNEFGGEAMEGYEAVLAREDVAAVYIGLPHHLHAEWTIKAAQAGKAILCEKPFTLTVAEAEKALAVVKECGVFFMEAFMYRCHPQTLKLRDILSAGMIGTPEMVHAEFGYGASKDWDNFRTQGALGGGALMDVGTYCTTMAQLVFDDNAIRSEYIARIGEGGYDEIGSGVLEFTESRSLAFGTAVHQNLGNEVHIYGSEGRITITQPWKPYKEGVMSIFKHNNPSADQTWSLGTDNDDLYGYEADAVAEYMAAKECPHMPIDDTIGNMRTLDSLRRSAGLHFEGEELR